jgi:hypothetical protein
VIVIEKEKQSKRKTQAKQKKSKKLMGKAILVKKSFK